MSQRNELEFALADFEEATREGVTKSARLYKASLLADAARAYLDDEPVAADDDCFKRDPNSACYLGLTIMQDRSVTIDGITYRTAFNAFQAHKAPIADRGRFAHVKFNEAANMGRRCQIDPVAWDTGRDALMTKILRHQANQHPEFAKTIALYGATVVEDSMGDPYWPTALPSIWAALATEFARMGDEEADDDDDDNGVSAGKRRRTDHRKQQGKKLRA